MKIRIFNKKEGFVKLMPEILDDLWHIEQTIETGDHVSGVTDRKIKGKDENQHSERKMLFVTIEVQTCEFHEYSRVLKVNGIVIESKPEELAPLKSHQSIDFELGKEIKIHKKEWKNYQIDRLKKAEKNTNKETPLLIVLDDETATFGWLKEFDLIPAGSLRGKKTGKQFDEKENPETGYFTELLNKISELKPKTVVIAGPGFTKDNFKKYLKDRNQKIGQTVHYETTNATGITGLLELVKNGSLEKVIQEAQFLQDSRRVERFLAELGKQSGLAEYGLDAVANAADRSAIDELMVLDTQLMANSKPIETIMKKTEESGAKIHILNAKSDPGKKIAGFGGIVAILRYKMR